MSATRKPVRLTEKQKAFVREYLVDYNAAKAALRAGFSPHSAHDQARQLLTKPHIKAALEERKRAVIERCEIAAADVINELAILGLSDISHYRLDEMMNLILAPGAPNFAMRAIRGVKHRVRTIVTDEGEMEREHTIEYSLWDKNAALTNLAKHFRLLIDRFEVTAPIAEEVRRMAAEHGLTEEEVYSELRLIVGGN
jgi:phage terminase small subunit